MIVYGDPQYTASLDSLVTTLRARLAQVQGAPTVDGLRTLLIAAGQVEQAAHDGLPGLLPPRTTQAHIRRLHTVTAQAARAFVLTWCTEAAGGGVAVQAVGAALAQMGRELAALPARSAVSLTVKVPEGFAFYALYPEQYVVAAQRWLADHAEATAGRVLVVGIRSIGTTLAAVVGATLAAGGVTVSTCTVRPTGHPFAREVADLRAEDVAGAAWGLLVDEGPGLSGSSLAAGAEALVRAGLPRANISFFPGHAGEPGHAASDSVRAWWASTPRYVAPPTLPPSSLLTGALHLEDCGGGLWRGLVYPTRTEWPAVCAAFEQPKYRSTDATGQQVLWKFAGLLPGADGQTGAERAVALLAARQSWGPTPLGTAQGWVATRWVEGVPLRQDEGHPALLAHIGRYIAAVAGLSLPDEEQAAALTRLQEMLYWNTWEALGEAVAAQTRQASPGLLMHPRLPRYGDGHLAPHEWLRTPEGQIVKVDNTGHDHDHTAVGPQAVAWDLAAAWVEWRLDAQSAVPLLAAYEAAGGPTVALPVLAFYRQCYAAFRLGQCHLCAEGAGHDPEEQARLWAAYARYRGVLEQELAGECNRAVESR